ncbi:MAG: hypothetical protein F6K24_33355, partial [Okeania sp. SIO2D1]|nr:hypothetical protein [Okeania sp. SIO2D1]
MNREALVVGINSYPFLKKKKLGDLNLKALLVFYHPKVLTQLSNLRQYFIDRRAGQTNDSVDDWIQMVATNR